MASGFNAGLYKYIMNQKWWNNGLKSKRSYECPGVGWVEGRLPFKRKSPSNETKQKISDSLKGKPVWNSGVKNPYSEDTIKKMSDSAKARSKRGILPDNNGCTPWNKGLTLDTHPSIKASADKQRGIHVPGRVRKVEYDIAKFKDYARVVRALTEQTYRKYKTEINPNDYPRGCAGRDGIWHLDHIIPIFYGFQNNISPKIMSNKMNLRMLPWEDNLKRSRSKVEDVAAMTELMGNGEWA